MDAFNAWRHAPAMALYLGRQSLSEKEALDICKPLAAGQWASERIEIFRQKIFQGQKVNLSENRAAGHWALRSAAIDQPFTGLVQRFAPDGQDLIPRMRSVHEQSRLLAKQIREGGLKSQSGRRFKSILHLGIGGSDIGPKLLVKTLANTQNDLDISVAFISNLDYHALAHTLEQLDPHETLVVIASKSFATQETVMNTQHVLQWMRDAGVTHEERQCIAVTQRIDRAAQADIPDHQTLWVDESIGGRFSIWGPVSITARIALGNTVVDEFIRGGLRFDEHFLQSPAQDNLAAILAAIDFYNLRERHLPSLMVSAYDSRLEMLVPYLNQLWMESLGKHVDVQGKPIEGLACPILWGDIGTNAQHAFFQLLHQGAQGVAIELIGIVQPAHEAIDSHRALLANLIAQAQALSTGCEDAQASKSCWGGHPVNLLLLDRCNAESLGALIALWEHRVECMAALTGVNPFDQWGVELGKTIAASALHALSQNPQLTKVIDQVNSQLDEKSLEIIHWLKRDSGL
jgi:glucose-6-phosphate isomerase